MKLAFSTLGCPEWTWKQILSAGKAYGMDGVEVRGIGPVLDNREIPEFQENRLEQTREDLKQAGLTLPVLGASCAFHSKERYVQAMEEGRAAALLCQKLGIPYLRVFGDALPEPQTMAQVCRGLRELCELSADKGVSVLLEIHGEFNTCQTVEPVLDALSGQENFGILWDVEHSHRAYGAGWKPFYQLIAPFVRHVHIKDCVLAGPEKTPSLTLPGEGEIPLRDIVSTLLDQGYAGYFSLEWEKRWVPELPDLDAALNSFTKLMRGMEKNP